MKKQEEKERETTKAVKRAIEDSSSDDKIRKETRDMKVPVVNRRKKET